MNVASSCLLLLFLVACVSSQEAALEKMTPVVSETEAQSEAEAEFERIDDSRTWQAFSKKEDGFVYYLSGANIRLFRKTAERTILAGLSYSNHLTGTERVDTIGITRL
ncbi:MAG: hypothetical protein H6618_02330 [Deltaproteobacteria bacterium]|nr:hypothetical protein [Deltaproteobacteria bacterium]